MMPERKPKAPAYENGTRSDVLRYALECAVRDREGMLESITSQVVHFWKMPREEALAKLSEDDRAYFIEIESYIRDFEKMGKKLG
jgi:hypothetical protein